MRQPATVLTRQRAPQPHRNAIRARRPKFLVRRRAGAYLNPPSIHQDEREIIARS
jgi:hypothetical protein